MIYDQIKQGTGCMLNPSQLLMYLYLQLNITGQDVASILFNDRKVACISRCMLKKEMEIVNRLTLQCKYAIKQREQSHACL